MKDILIVIALWNVIVFAVYGADKYKAIHGSWRISELALILMSFLLGGIGGFCGMRIWHHKTRHWKFRILVPLSLAVSIAGIAGIVMLMA